MFDIQHIQDMKDHREFVPLLINSWPSIEKELLAGRALVEAVKKMDALDYECKEITDLDSAWSVGCNVTNREWREERDDLVKRFESATEN